MLDYLKLFYYLLRPNTIFLRRISNALGDNILLSVLLPHLRKQYPGKKIVVESPRKEIFYHNPHVDWVTDKHFKTTKRHLKPKYRITHENCDSIIQQILSYVSEKNNTLPEIYLLKNETEYIKEKYPAYYITICPTGKTKFSANRKEWGVNKFQELIHLMPEFTFIQTGMPNDELLSGVIDARGLTIRQTAALLSSTILFIGLEGGLMHLAKAVGSKSAIIYGGYIQPKSSAYDDDLIFSTKPECSPCYTSERKQIPCETMICMKPILPEAVADQIRVFIRENNLSKRV